MQVLDGVTLAPGTWVVTGATGHLGPAVARAMVDAGARELVLGCRRRAAELEALCRDLRAAGAHRVAGVVADLGEDVGLARVLEAVQAMRPPVAGLVHLAGQARRAPLAELTRQDLRQALAGHLEGGLLLAARLAPLLAPGASLVLFGSAATRYGRPGHLAYAAAMAGLEGAVRSLAVELAPLGARANLVQPGVIGEERDAEVQQMGNMIPLGRPGTRRELAQAVVFLLSPAAAYITGQVLPVSGGL